MVVIRVAGDDDVADAGELVALLQVFGEEQGAGVRHADEFFVDVVVELFEVEHDEVGVVEQGFQGVVVMAGVAVGVEAGVDAVGLAGDEPVADEFGLQQRFAAACGHAAAGGFQIEAVLDDLLHQFVHGDLARFVGFHVPGVAVVAVKATHQAALGEDDEAQAGAVHGAAGFDGMDDAVTHGSSRMVDGVILTDCAPGGVCRARQRVRVGQIPG